MPRRWLELSLLVWMFAALLTAPASAGARIIGPDSRDDIVKLLSAGHNRALLIGISDYDSGSWSSLPGVPQEIERIRAVLEKRHNFTIDAPTGVMTKQRLVAEIRRFLRENGGNPSNRLIVYIATHGFGRKEGDRQMGYIIAQDSLSPSEPGFSASAYSVDELTADLSRGTDDKPIEAQHVFLLFNSCFSGAMVPAAMRGNAFENEYAKAARALSAEAAKWTLKLLSHNARMVLTAGNDLQEVPDRDNPFSNAVIAGLEGAADGDGDGLILGMELATYVRSRVAQETRANGFENDPVFAIIPKDEAPTTPRPGAPPVDPKLQGDFVFLSPTGARDKARAGVKETEEILASRNRALGNASMFTECADCPVMADLSEQPAPGEAPVTRLALARTEITYAEWDACFRELRCSRYIPDFGAGRGDRPVGGVTWQDAQEFLVWVNSKGRGKQARCSAYRLPTSSEWREAAIVGLDGLKRVSAAGRAICDGCGTRFDASSAAASSAVQPGGYGLYNMFGNLWEWVDDDKPEGRPMCDLKAITDMGSCSAGRVAGGSFATASGHIDAMARPAAEQSVEQSVVDIDVATVWADMPRTSNAKPFSLPTVGLRVACDLAPPKT